MGKKCLSIFPFDVWDKLWVRILPVHEVSLLIQFADKKKINVNTEYSSVPQNRNPQLSFSALSDSGQTVCSCKLGHGDVHSHLAPSKTEIKTQNYSPLSISQTLIMLMPQSSLLYERIYFYTFPAFIYISAPAISNY